MYKNGKQIEEYFLEASESIIDSNDNLNMENIILMHFEIAENVACKLEIV